MNRALLISQQNASRGGGRVGAWTALAVNLSLSLAFLLGTDGGEGDLSNELSLAMALGTAGLGAVLRLTKWRAFGNGLLLGTAAAVTLWSHVCSRSSGSTA